MDPPQETRKEKKNSCVIRTGISSGNWPFTRGHTNLEQCFSCHCFAFVWPRVNLLLVFPTCPLSLSHYQMSVYSTLYLGPLSSLATLLLNPVSRHPRSSLSHSLPQVRLQTTPRILGNGWTFSLCLLSCCQYTTFSRWLPVPEAD